MRNRGQIVGDVDSIKNRIKKRKVELFEIKKTLFIYDFYKDLDNTRLPEDLEKFRISLDSIERERDRDRERTVYENIDSKEKRSRIASPDSIAKSGDTTLRKPSKEYLDSLPIKSRRYISELRNNTAGNPTEKAKSALPIPEVVVDPVDTLTEEMIYEEILRIDTTNTSLDDIMDQQMAKVRQAKNRIYNDSDYIARNEKEMRIFEIQYHKILANSVACLVMFLIGAPLGSIIKKGGLGIPVLISILFFIIFYVLMIMGEKWTKNGLIEAWQGIWLANIILFPVGMFFLLQARRDARLFDSDWYLVAWEKVKGLWKKS